MATLVEAKAITLDSNNASVEEFCSDGVTPLVEWTAKTYKNGDEVKVEANNKKYKFSGVDDADSAKSPELEAFQWVPSPLNPAAMLVYNNSVQTTKAESLDFSFQAKNIDTIALFNVAAQTVEIDVKNNPLTTELMASGDGATLTFNYTSNVLPFEATIELWVNGVKEAEDIVGDGVLTDVAGNYALSSGTVDYTTGAVSASFATAPANLVAIQLKYNSKIYSISKPMYYDDLFTLADYLFSPRKIKTALVNRFDDAELDALIASMSNEQILENFTGLFPSFADLTVYVSIKNSGSIAKCGHIVVGYSDYVGRTLYNGSMLIDTTGSQERDFWGHVTFTEGEVFNTMDLPVLVDTSLYDATKSKLEKLVNKPLLVIGDEGDSPIFQSATMWCYYSKVELPMSKQTTEFILRTESIQ